MSSPELTKAFAFAIPLSHMPTDDIRCIVFLAFAPEVLLYIELYGRLWHRWRGCHPYSAYSIVLSTLRLSALHTPSSK